MQSYVTFQFRCINGLSFSQICAFLCSSKASLNPISGKLRFRDEYSCVPNCRRGLIRREGGVAKVGNIFGKILKLSMGGL